MGWTNNQPDILVLPFGATSGARIVIDGTNDRIMIYDSNDNPVIVLAASNGTEPTGLAYQTGMNVYDSTRVNTGVWLPGGFKLSAGDNGVSGGFIAVNDIPNTTQSPAVNFGTALFNTLSSGAFVILTVVQGTSPNQYESTFIAGPTRKNETAQSGVQLEFRPAFPGVEESATCLFEWFNSSTGNTPAQFDNNGFHIFAGDVNGVVPGTASPPTAETWHILPTGLNGWDTSNAAYRVSAEKELKLVGHVTHTGAITSNEFVQLPTGYRVPIAKVVLVPDTAHTNVFALQLNTDGTAQILNWQGNTLTAGAQIQLDNVCVPLDA